MVVEHHYAHRAVPVSWAFGAYFNGVCVGVISFGKPASPHVCIGVCGHKNSGRVYELNRLWMSDVCPRNSESRFIAWSLRQLKRVAPPIILVSYADTAQSHQGIVYKATGWLYTGLSQERKIGDLSLDGVHSRHGRTLGNAVRITRSRKHRYVYLFNKQDMDSIRWPIKSNKPKE